MTEFPSLEVTDDKLATSLQRLRQYATKVMSNFIEIYFTDHSIAHLLRIHKLIDTVLRQNNKPQLLSQYERYVLSAGIYLHDLGMQDETAHPKAHDRRSKHHLRSAEIIERDWEQIGLIEDFVSTIALIVRGHRGEIDNRYGDKIIGTGEVVRCDLLAALLYLGDELDVSSERVDITRKKFLNYKADAALHFYKHYYTQGVTIGDDRCLHVDFRYPSEERRDQYATFFEKIVMGKLAQTIQELVPILQSKHQLFLAVTKETVKTEINPALESIDPALFEQIVNESLGVRNFRFLRRQNFEESRGDLNPKLFYEGNVRWADIVNDLDIRRVQYNEILKELRLLFETSISRQCLTGLLICGEAGAGKTTALMRLAYDAISDGHFEMSNLLWSLPDSAFDLNEIKHLVNSSLKPAIIFVDGLDIDKVVSSIKEQLRDREESKFPMVIVFAARLNEWENAGGGKIPFQQLLCIQLRTLEDSEMTDLLRKLEQYGELHELSALEPQERFQRLKAKSSGKLLVAMLEATRAKKFEDIVYDEYTNIKNQYPEAAKAYELICMFYIFGVLVPEEFLVALVMCSDPEEFREKVLQHTHLIIVRHGLTRFGIYYRARHMEIAQVLIDRLGEYELGEKRLRKLTIALRLVETSDRRQRYVVLEYLKSYVVHITKFQPKIDFPIRIQEIQNFLSKNLRRIHELILAATKGKHKSELALWAGLYQSVRMQSDYIFVLEKILSIDLYDRKWNHKLARELSHTKGGRDNPEMVAQYFRNSFMGGNRRTLFLYEYLDFCLKYGLFHHLDPIIDGFTDFISYTPEEEQLKEKLNALLKGYKIRRDRQELASRFGEIKAHISATEDLNTLDEIEYIDKIESSDRKSTLKNYEIYLMTIAPSRPKGVLLRIAHLAAKIVGEEKKALEYYREYCNRFVRPSPTIEEFEATFEYVTFAVRNKLQRKEENYSLFKLCKILNPKSVKTYAEFSSYALACGDKNLGIEQAKEGLNVASEIDEYNTSFAETLKKNLLACPGA